MFEIRVKIKRLYEDSILPVYANDGDSGADVCAHGVRFVEGERVGEVKLLKDYGPVYLLPFQRCLITTGLGVAIPKGTEIQVRPRSGNALKRGLTVLNSPGTVDSTYRGELGVIAYNSTSSEIITIEPGERVAQIVLTPVLKGILEEVQELDSTERSLAGYGSTGK